MFYYDSTYIFVLAALALSLIAQGMVSSAYKKYEKIQTRKGLPAARVADEILRQNGNQAVSVRPVPGTLTDHYDPRNETLSLSEGVYNSASIAAVGIAAHEAGHAMQKQEGYGPLALRSLLVPVVNIGSNLGLPIVILGLVMSIRPLITIGIVMFGLVVAFTLITLPVEFDASKRALAWLEQTNITTAQEQPQAKDALKWAAMTYVVAAIASLVTLVQYIFIYMGRSRE